MSKRGEKEKFFKQQKNYEEKIKKVCLWGSSNFDGPINGKRERINYRNFRQQQKNTPSNPYDIYFFDEDIFR